MTTVTLQVKEKISLSVARYNELIALEQRKCRNCRFWDDGMVKGGGIPLGNKHGYCEKLRSGRDSDPAYLVGDFANESLRPTAEFSCALFEEK